MDLLLYIKGHMSVTFTRDLPAQPSTVRTVDNGFFDLEKDSRMLRWDLGGLRQRL